MSSWKSYEADGHLSGLELAFVPVLSAELR